MRWLTAGESHGQALSAIVEGIPASVSVTTADIDFHLQRRRLGVGRGARQNFEADKVTILGGVRLGLTQGGPIAIQVGKFFGSFLFNISILSLLIKIQFSFEETSSLNLFNL